MTAAHAPGRVLHLLSRRMVRLGDPPIFLCQTCNRFIVHQSSDPVSCPCGAPPCPACLAEATEGSS